MSEIEELLNIARDASMHYFKALETRDVMPTKAAIQALACLKEPLPKLSTDPQKVFEELDRIGSPATVATTGGRFFGNDDELLEFLRTRKTNCPQRPAEAIWEAQK